MKQEKETTGPSSKKIVTSGTGSTAIDSLEVVRIIRECGRAGVRRISFRGLELEFCSDKLMEPPKTKEPQKKEAVPVSFDQNEIEEPKIMLNPEDREMLREFDELQLAIDDPIAYEQAQISEDFDHARVRGLGERNQDRGSEQAL